MTLRVGSLCAGYGGLEEGVRSVLGGTIAWQSEIDPGACKILAHRYPGVPNLGDMTVVDWSTVEPVDVLCGGTPCQDLSHAGKRAGMSEGTRSNLWVAMREAIRILRPRLVVWENVRGAYSARADSELESREGRVGDGGDGPVLRALGRVLGDLSELGFDAEWVGLRAADVGAPHGRFRVFAVAWPTSGDPDGGDRYGWTTAGQQGEARPEARCATAENSNVAACGERRIAAPGQAEGGRSRADSGRRGGAPAADADDAGRGEPRGSVADGTQQPAAERGGAAADPAGDGRHERRPEPARQLGGPHAPLGGDQTVCPTCGDPAEFHDEGGFCAGYCGGNCQDPDLGRCGVWNTDDGTPPAANTDSDGRESVRGLHAIERDTDGRCGAHIAWGVYESAIRRWERVLGRAAPPPTELSPKGSPRLSPAFVEWMMGLPASWVTGVPGLTRNEQLKALGNGVLPAQAAHALRLLLADVPA